MRASVDRPTGAVQAGTAGAVREPVESPPLDPAPHSSLWDTPDLIPCHDWTCATRWLLWLARRGPLAWVQGQEQRSQHFIQQVLQREGASQGTIRDPLGTSSRHHHPHWIPFSD